MTLTQDEIIAARYALDKYYGINEGLIGNVSLNSAWDYASLLKGFESLADPYQHRTLLNALSLLVCCLLESPGLQRELKSDELFEQMRHREYLHLYQFCKSIRNGETVFIRNSINSLRINNYSNWFVQELMNPFLKEKLNSITDLESALRGFGGPKPIKKGRRANDPRIAILLWGSYKMISDDIAFSSPMPNSLCNVLILLLQLSKVLPASPVIDSFWIRAQLRYIRSRPIKPRFPIQD